MDFGITTFNNTHLLNHDEKTNTIINSNLGSGFTKQERSEPEHPPDDQQPFLPTSKSSRTDYFDQPNKTMPMRSDTNNMLSFSSSNSTKDGNNPSSIFSFYQPSPAYIRNTGYGTGGLHAGIQMPVSRYKGPFTPSQWMELEHQALIYKHFVANVPVPSHLLNPLRKSVNTFLFPGSSSSTSYAPNSYGWGGFQLGFSGGNSDPEPGRCRRTDGKKWRCSRDAVPDQKYCERHINRGRHRSRKPVEGHNGHALSSSATTTTTKVSPLLSNSSTTRPSPTALGGGAALSNQFKTLHQHNATAITSSTVTPVSRTQELQAFANNSFSIPKHNPIEESSDSLLYSTNYNSFMDHNAPNPTHNPNPNPNPDPLSHFIDPWSKELKPDWTQLSMSIPMAASDFSSSSNSPAQEKLTGPPLGLSHEFDLDPTHKPVSNWIPISWGHSLGGPLGEVLNRTSSLNTDKGKTGILNTETNHMSEMWDSVNYNMGSSPTGVLQKTTFVSLSNSSSGSSPKGGNKRDDHGGGGSGGGGGGGSLCDELLLSTLAS